MNNSKQWYNEQLDKMYTQGCYADMLLSVKPISYGCTPVSTLPTAVVPQPLDFLGSVAKEKGNKPMRSYETNAIATVTAQKSDVATQREYLLERLRKAEYSKYDELTKMFHLYVDNKPKTPQQLIDAIKDNKYTVDTESFDKANKRPGYYNVFEGLIWDGPKPDRDGYEIAVAKTEEEKTSTKDMIMVFSAEEGLKALQAFEAWVPDNAPKN